MSITTTGQMHCRPTHPGEMLRQDFLPDYGLTVSGLATAIGVSRQSTSELLRGRRAASPEMALRLKYHNSNADALADLERAKDVGRVFAGFQKYLYQPEAAA